MLDTLMKLVEWFRIARPAMQSMFNMTRAYDILSDDDKELLHAAMFALFSELYAIDNEIVEIVMLESLKGVKHDTCN